MKNKVLSIFAATLFYVFGTQSAVAQTAFAECIGIVPADFDGTVVDAAIATPELSTLVDAVVAAGLADALANADNITVFAPTNDAFANIPGPILETIVGDVDLLTEVLTYHVLPQRTDPRSFIPTQRYQSLQGQRVFLNRAENQPRVNNAVADCQGVRASNGTVWIIDSVLLPNI